MESSPSKGSVRCLAIGPTRELAAQIKEQFALFGEEASQRVCLLHGGVGYKEQNDCLKAGADVVVATQGRLLDHVQHKTLDLSSVEYLVLDEVDRMLDMGFVEDVLKLLNNVKIASDKPCSFLLPCRIRLNTLFSDI